MADIMLNVSGRFNRESFKKNEELLSVENMKKGMQVRGKHLWELPFYSNKYQEDNDTSDEESDSEEEQTKVEISQGNKTKKITLREGHGLEFFLEKEEEFLVKRKKKQQEKDDMSEP